MTWVVRAKGFTQRIQGLTRRLPLYDFSKKNSCISRESTFPLTSLRLAQPDITGRSGDEAAAACDNVCYRWGHFSPVWSSV